VTANAASTTANGIAATANTALTSSTNAVTTANTANSTATTANTTANTANTTANSALSTANSAVSTANSALTFAQAINPVGAVIWVATSTAPNGFLKANGAAVSRTTYAALFAALGTQFGAGDGSSTFNVPDLRGEFIRGWDDSRGVDSGRTFGSFQADEFKSHFHAYAASRGSSDYGGSNAASGSPSAGTTSPAGGAETRPRNVALLACIKF
jgi:microcystin-dependent protein